VILSAVAIARRYLEERESSRETVVSILLHGDKDGGPEKYNLFYGRVKAWETDLLHVPRLESYQFGHETGGRETDRLDGLRISVSVWFGDSLDPSPQHAHHYYPALGQWTRDEGCSTITPGRRAAMITLGQLKRIAFIIGFIRIVAFCQSPR
jgi:hypothetical protein